MPARCLLLKMPTRSEAHYFSEGKLYSLPQYRVYYNRKVIGKIRQDICHSQMPVKNLLIKKLKIIDNSANPKNILPVLSAKIFTEDFSLFVR